MKSKHSNSPQELILVDQHLQDVVLSEQVVDFADRCRHISASNGSVEATCKASFSVSKTVEWAAVAAEYRGIQKGKFLLEAFKATVMKGLPFQVRTRLEHLYYEYFL